jgi:hypothetical protein
MESYNQTEFVKVAVEQLKKKGVDEVGSTGESFIFIVFRGIVDYLANEYNSFS